MANKLNPEEPIKALECLAYHKECPESEVCQYYMDNGNICDNISLARDTLDLINRKQAEIERLQGAVQEWVDGKCLSQKHLLTIGKLQNEIETAKAEAIKEFAERFKNSLKGYGGLYCRTTMNVRIDNLVKEMVGDDK